VSKVRLPAGIDLAGEIIIAVCQLPEELKIEDIAQFLRISGHSVRKEIKKGHLVGTITPAGWYAVTRHNFLRYLDGITNLNIEFDK
jgi:hypothetical protein